MKFTKEQQLVIDTRGCNLLVSAAAGSGKTAVLVERIMKKLTDAKAPVDVDRLLVMTFTKAAAAEMKDRLEKRISGQLEDAIRVLGEADADADRASKEALVDLLRRQSALLHSASITTIHGFCTGVLRNYFNKIDLDPAFRVAEEGELKLLQNDVIEQVLEDAYEAGGEEFLHFADYYAGAKTDRNIEEAVLSLYEYSRANPDPEKWLRDACRCYECENLDALFAVPAVMEYYRHIYEDMKGLLVKLDVADEICKESDGPYFYEKMLESDREAIASVLEALPEDGMFTQDSYVNLRAILQNVSFVRRPSKKDPSVDLDKKDQVDKLRDSWKDAVKELAGQEFSLDPDILFDDVNAAGESVKALTELTIAFSNAYQETKRQRSIVDFGDLEHFTLEILYDRDDDGNMVPSAQAYEYREEFEEIMVDEYQDSNMVQEYILRAVSKSDDASSGNLFMVGDVKQSIYGFRLADPSLFAAKLREYPVTESTEHGRNARIDLHKNFRSRRQVVDFVNVLCRQLMHESIGEVEYDKSAELVQGAVYGEGNPNASECSEHEADEENGVGPWDTQLLLVDPEGEDRKIAEATMIAEKILEMIEQKMPVQQKDHPEENRPIKFSDIAILLRSTSGWADTFANTLNEFGIPTIVGTKAGYFDSYEIQAILNYLEVINNPKDDETLCAAMHGPFGMIGDEDLAKIRIFHPEGSFCEAAEAVLKEGDETKISPALCTKLRQFYDRLRAFQEKAEYMPIHLLLTEIISVTHYDLMIQAMDGGQQRLLNLTMLLEKAGEFEGISYKGVFHFVRYIRQLRKFEVDYGIPDDGNDAGNAVRIMTIHKSKGLEFPVCFVSGCAKMFNDTDLKKNLITDDKLGIGLQTVRVKKRTKNSNLLRGVMIEEKKRKMYGEELRILYVALTRAREKLIITGGIKTDGISKSIVQSADLLMRLPDVGVFPSMIMKGNSFLDWIILGLLNGINNHIFKEDLTKMLSRPASETEEDAENPGLSVFHFSSDLGEDKNYNEDLKSKTKIEILWSPLLELEDGVLFSQLKKEDQLLKIYEMLRESENCPVRSIEKQFSWCYPYGEEYAIPIKVSVSDLKHEAMKKLDTEDAPVVASERSMRPEPEFIKGRNERENIGSERGTAYHRVFELLEYHGDLSYAGIEKQIESFVERGLMDKNGADMVCINHICQFAESEIGKRMKAASDLGTLHREQPFVYSAPACELDPKYLSTERVLVQGIIDAIFRENDEYVIVDYKTDNVESMERLADLYREQLNQYRNAIMQITGGNVKACVIYSVKFGREIEV